MNWRSHIFVGATSAAGVAVVASQVPGLHSLVPSHIVADAPMIAASAFAALWPDGDSKRSKMGHWLPGHQVLGRDGWAGRSWLGVTCWHRRRWHSVGALGIVATVALLLAAGSGADWTWGIAAGVMVGYGSHLLADIPYGKQMLYWPFSDRLVGWRELTAGLSVGVRRAVRLS